MNLASQPAELLDQLQTVVHQAVEDPRHGYRIAKQTESLLHPGQAFPIAGLEQVFWYWHCLAGRRPERRLYCGPHPLGPDDRSWMSPTTVVDHHLLAFVHGHGHGVVRYGDGVDVAHLIAQVARMFPRARLAVVSSRNRTVFRLRQRLRVMRIADVTVATGKHCQQPPGRVVVSSYIGLAEPNIEIEQREIVIAVDALEGVGFGPTGALWATKSARLFGLLPSSRGLSPRDADRITTIFGLDELEIPRHGHQRIGVSAVWSQIAGPTLTLGDGADQQLRSGVWTNPLRNRRIAALARALRSTSRAEVQQRFPEVARHLPEQDPLRVVVLTESLDHALALKEKLPDWPLVTGTDVITDGLTDRQQEWLRGSVVGWVPMERAIATSSGAANIDFKNVDIVVWAGAGPCLPPIPQDRLVCPADRPHSVLLVDFRDQQHPCLRRWSCRRRAAYQQAGWFQAGEDPAAARIRRFLAARPTP